MRLMCLATILLGAATAGVQADCTEEVGDWEDRFEPMEEAVCSTNNLPCNPYLLGWPKFLTLSGCSSGHQHVDYATQWTCALDECSCSYDWDTQVNPQTFSTPPVAPVSRWKDQGQRWEGVHTDWLSVFVRSHTATGDEGGDSCVELKDRRRTWSWGEQDVDCAP